jgi:uncharacterized protein YjeT (DUF2065 family)
LKEAKDAVDAYLLRTQPALCKRMAAAQTERNQGFLRWLAGILIFAALAIYWSWTKRTRGGSLLLIGSQQFWEKIARYSIAIGSPSGLAARI